MTVFCKDLGGEYPQLFCYSTSRFGLNDEDSKQWLLTNRFKEKWITFSSTSVLSKSSSERQFCLVDLSSSVRTQEDDYLSSSSEFSSSPSHSWTEEWEGLRERKKIKNNVFYFVRVVISLLVYLGTHD